MIKVKRFMRKWWWLFVVGAVAVLGVLMAIFLNRGDDGEPAPPPQYLGKARQEVERARLEGEIERARITATADVERGQLDEIELVGENDPAEGRRQIADWLAANL